MNGHEINAKIANMADEKVLRIYNNMKNDEDANLEIFFKIVDEKEKRNL